MEILSAATMLFLIMDPLGNLPIVLSILKHIDPKRRRIVLIRELMFALIIIVLVCRSEHSELFARSARNLKYFRRYYPVYHRD